MGTAASVNSTEGNVNVQEVVSVFNYDMYKSVNAYDVYKQYLEKNNDNGQSYIQMCITLQKNSDNA
jgi:hypothetical protein